MTWSRSGCAPYILKCGKTYYGRNDRVCIGAPNVTEICCYQGHLFSSPNSERWFGEAGTALWCLSVKICRRWLFIGRPRYFYRVFRSLCFIRDGPKGAHIVWMLQWDDCSEVVASCCFSNYALSRRWTFVWNVTFVCFGHVTALVSVLVNVFERNDVISGREIFMHDWLDVHAECARVRSCI